MNPRRAQRRQKETGVIQGTVPYLGTFLTDLVMLDTAMKDYLYVSEPGPVVGSEGQGLRPGRTEPLLIPELWFS